MRFYYPQEDRVIETQELINKFGTSEAIPQLGIVPLERFVNQLNARVARLNNEKESS